MGSSVSQTKRLKKKILEVQIYRKNARCLVDWLNERKGFKDSIPDLAFAMIASMSARNRRFNRRTDSPRSNRTARLDLGTTSRAWSDASKYDAAHITADDRVVLVDDKRRVNIQVRCERRSTVTTGTG